MSSGGPEADGSGRTAGDAEGDDRPPPGFVVASRGPFSTHNGPFYQKPVQGGVLHGLRARKRHCNGAGIVHGGLLMAFADGLLASAIWHETRSRMVTIRMTSDFLSMARPGDWIEGHARVRMADGDVAFADGVIHVGERPVLTAHALFKVLRAV